MNRQIDEIADIISAQRSGRGSYTINRVSIDSRQSGPGTLFFALPGTRYDGHEFVPEVLEKGGAAVVNHLVPDVDTSRLLVVPEVAAALQNLARYHRLASEVKVIAVTGSVGKTTTKDMIAAILSSSHECLKSEGNYNNELGLPLTLLALQDEHRMAVVEMGMRGRGQIAQLAHIAAPDIAVITNIAPVHLELLGSVEKIAQAKCEVLDYLNPRGFALINGDIALLKEEAIRHDALVYTFGRGEENDIRLVQTSEVPEGLVLRCRIFEEEEELFIPLLSENLALNVLAAAAVGRQLGVPWTTMADVLNRFAPGGHRLRNVEIGGNVTVIDDCYNANPLSMVAGLQVLARQKRGRQAVSVLGDMMELGSLEKEAHLQVGREAARLADRLITVGSRARWYAEGAIQADMPPHRIDMFESNGQAISFIKQYVNADAAILIKGSRSMQMEEIVAALIGRKI
ncbi:MAG: UDP-N-acetylmuramoyl-tripeptide--D-alanyl-D-alanine ligase [Methylocystaceae bacterium]